MALNVFANFEFRFMMTKARLMTSSKIARPLYSQFILSIL
jgi:hypothetical protein